MADPVQKAPATSRGFPWVSALSLLYPVAAMISLAGNAPTVLVIGYGLGTLAFCCLLLELFLVIFISSI
jgi:hypothetical protein